MEYNEFIASKRVSDPETGFVVEKSKLNKNLFDFQRDIVAWALRRGRAAVWADCGLGKTLMQLEWANQVTTHTGGKVLIVSPLAVSYQTIKEGAKFGIDVVLVSDDSECKIKITNYEKLHKINVNDYVGIVLDESSIIKSFTGKIRNEIISKTTQVQFKLACTATPAPNDFVELGNHAEFVGSMGTKEMLSMFFVNDMEMANKWRLKGHAQTEFWKWICSWAVMIRRPSDLGYSNGNYTLPTLNMHQVVCDVDMYDSHDGFLFRMPASTLSERQTERKLTIDGRAKRCADIVNAEPNKQWLIWCNLNNEAESLKKYIHDAVEVSGSDSDESKIEKMNGFTTGKYRILITKPKIAGHGMNWQNCHKMAFVGLSDSYEQFYQAVRRCWRFGQKQSVDCYVITASTEGAVVKNIQRKEKDSELMALEMVKNMHVYNETNIKGIDRNKTEYNAVKMMALPSFIK